MRGGERGPSSPSSNFETASLSLTPADGELSVIPTVLASTGAKHAAPIGFKVRLELAKDLAPTVDTERLRLLVWDRSQVLQAQASISPWTLSGSVLECSAQLLGITDVPTNLTFHLAYTKPAHVSPHFHCVLPWSVKVPVLEPGAAEDASRLASADREALSALIDLVTDQKPPRVSEFQEGGILHTWKRVAINLHADCVRDGKHGLAGFLYRTVLLSMMTGEEAARWEATLSSSSMSLLLTFKDPETENAFLSTVLVPYALPVLVRCQVVSFVLITATYWRCIGHAFAHIFYLRFIALRVVYLLVVLWARKHKNVYNHVFFVSPLHPSPTCASLPSAPIPS